MSREIDEKVLEMRFENEQFERNVATSMSTLDKLKQSLNLTGAARGLEDINDAAKSFDPSILTTGIETVKNKFSALEVMAITTLANITNSAINTGKQLVKSLSVDQIKAGWTKYEQKTQSVQTLVNSTGKSVKQIDRYLNRLMWFSDETSYSFTDMTAALAQMTSSGGDIDKLIPMITGIANAVAYAGKGSSEFSRAIYNLGQSYSQGFLSLMDWRSVQNAGANSKQLTEELIKAGEELGKIKKGTVTVGNFTEKLKNKWADTEVMERAFSRFSELSEAAYKAVEAGEYDTARDAIEALSKDFDTLSIRAFKSAQEAKSFTEAIDATKDAVSSGWLNSFEIIFGNYKEAKKLWSDLADALWDAFASGAEARNKLLQEWKDLGGRNALIKSFWNAWNGVAEVINTVKKAFRGVFPEVTAKNLLDFTKGLENLTSKLILSEKSLKKIGTIFKGLFSILDLGKQAISSVLKPLFNFLTDGTLSSIGGDLLTSAANISKFFIRLDKGAKEGKAFAIISDSISKALNKISDAIAKVKNGFSGTKEIFSSAWNNILGVVSKVGDTLKKVFGKAFGWISENVTFKDVFAGITAIASVISVSNVTKIIKKIQDFIDNIGKTFNSIDEKSTKLKDVLSDVRNTLNEFTRGIRIKSIVAIGVGVLMLSVSLRKIAELNPISITYSLGTIVALTSTLSIAFKALTKSLSSLRSKGLVKGAVSMVIIAEAINILTTAMVKMSKIPWNGLLEGLVGISVSLLALATSVKAIGKTNISLKTSISLIALATALNILASAVKTFGEMSWDSLTIGLSGMAVSLMGLVTAVGLIDKFKISLKTSVSLITLAAAMKILSSAISDMSGLSWDEVARGVVAVSSSLFALVGAVKIIDRVKVPIKTTLSIVVLTGVLTNMAKALSTFGNLSWGEILRGLTAMGGALAELVGVMAIMRKIGGVKTLIGSFALVKSVESLSSIAAALVSLGSLSWSEVFRSLTAMGVALAEVAVAAGALGKIAGLSGIIGAGALYIVMQGLNDMAAALVSLGSLSWSEIARGLTAMGGALVEIGVVSGALGYLTGIAGLIGAGTLYVAIQGLDDLANAFLKFSSASWDEVKRGLVAMGGALAEVGVISGALGYLTGFAGLLGAGTLYVAIQGLDDIANALQKFASMSWDEVKRGMEAMSAALSKTALGGLLNTFSGLGALSISKMAEPLGTLADSMKKWKDVSIPENLKENMGAIASAVSKFAFSNMGASPLAKIAPSIGVLGESFSKWNGVSIPFGIGTQLGNLAKGVEKFSFAFLGSWSIKSVAGSFGDLSEAVSKWNSVSLPSNIKEMLTDLADGVNAFSFAFVGGFSIQMIVEPLKSLVDSVEKWKDIKVPSNIKDNLQNLAEGIKQFSFIDSVKISTMSEPLNNMSAAFKRFGNMTVNPDSAANMLTISGKIKKVVNVLSSILDPAKKAKESVDVIYKIFNTIEKVNTENVGDFVSAANKLGKIKIGDIQVDGDNLKSAVSSVKSVMSSMTRTISNKKDSMNNSMQKALSGLPSTIKSKSKDISSAAKTIMDALTSAIVGKTRAVVTAMKAVLNNVSSAAYSHKTYMTTSGKQLGDGLIVGIRAKYTAVYNAAYILGQKAVQGERDGQKSKSPSKLAEQSGVWFGEGLINGIKRMYNSVYSAARNMGTGASDSLSESMSRVMDIVAMDTNMQPTIKPVLDLSDVERGANSLNGMFSMQQPVRVMADLRSVNSMANNRQQTASNDDVIFAIGRLETALKSNPGNTYNINGITYDDGSNIRDAISTLVHAAKIERRT